MSYQEFQFSTDDPPTLSEVDGEGTMVWRGDGKFYEALEFSERDRVELLNDTSTTGPDGRRYRLRAVENYGTDSAPRDILELLPIASEHLFVTALYLPSLDLELVGETDTDVLYAGVKGIAEEWLILDVLTTIKAKTEAETAFWERRRAQVEQQLLDQATSRDAAQPPRIRQVWHRTQAGYPRDRLCPPGVPWRR